MLRHTAPLLIVLASGCAAPKPAEPAVAAKTLDVQPLPADAGAGLAIAPNTDEPPATVENEPAERPEPDPIEKTAPRHRSKVLDGAVRPSKLAAGTYQCRIGAEYNLRPCTVNVDDRGFTWLEMPSALIHAKGVLYDEGNALVFDGAPAEPRPFGCFGCQERCSKGPKSCVCKEFLPGASVECLARPLTVRLTKKGTGYSGWLEHKNYINHYEGSGADRHITGWDTYPVRLLFEIFPPK